LGRFVLGALGTGDVLWGRIPYKVDEPIGANRKYGTVTDGGEEAGSEIY
jgi:hypothetical protein